MSDVNIPPEIFDCISIGPQSVDNATVIQKSNDNQLISQMSSLDILTNHHDIRIDDKFILKLTKGSQNVNKEVKDFCKVHHFTSEWNYEVVLAAIDGLDVKEYPQLFIFIIDVTNLGLNTNNNEHSSTKVAKLQEKLLKFGSDRPMIIQLTSEEENIPKIYFKEETLNYFTVINHQYDSGIFPSFLRSFLNGEFNNSEIDVLNAVQEFENCSLTLRFLRTLNLSDEFFGALVLDRATKGTKAEFLAALDSPFDCDGRILSNRAQQYISNVFGDDDPENDDSVLLTAIENENTEVTNYILTYWTHLIQQLPFEHQVKISTTAFKTNQLDVLCDLLEIADYPFPDDFKVDSVDHARLSKITTEKIAFKAAIETENFNKIDEFINNNRNQKFIYSPSNNSALAEAVILKKFGVFYYLKSLGFQGEKCDDILAKLSKKEKEQAVKLATSQRKKNVNMSEDVAPKSVMLLSMRSSVHNSRTEKIQASKYREKIMKWFIDIHKVAPELIDVAASCDYLKIIFDFESDSVENMSLTGSNATGSTYPVSKWIFVGAKLSDRNGNGTKQREQKIKGVLAHELCHYVMRLVYENQENPYYKYREDMKELFEEIVKIIDKWSAKDSECPDDECNGIISTVFTLYPSKDFHPELIVRAVQILTEFDDSEDKLNNLQEKYKILFEFCHIHVVPELRKYLQRNIEIIRLNGTFGLLPSFTKLKYELHYMNKVEKITDNKMVVLQTNVPKLLFLNIREYLQQKSGNLFDSQNIFIKPKKLKYQQLFDDFKQICLDNQELSIFVDCSKEIPDNLGNIFVNKELNFIFIVSSEVQCDKLNKIFKEQKIENEQKLEINYKWSDLTEKSQKLMLNTKINFQNNSQLMLKDVIQIDSKGCEATEDDKEGINDLIDDQLLNLVLENQQILINSRKNEENSEKYFQLLFKSRKFIERSIVADEEVKLDIANANLDSEEKNISEATSFKGKEQIILEVQLLLDVKDQKYVLISDQAGNGKSWVMKNFTKILRNQNPSNWATYVDLKQFIDEFKAQKGEPEFSSFMIENILKPKQKFEAKVFKKMYKNGKVLILFDGFDEVAPDCAEFVSKLAQNFQQNGGNQLWIATRDFFEVDLKEKLKLNVAYRIDEMTEKEGIELISRTWVLMDLKGISEPKSKEDLDKCIEKSQDFKNYQDKARQIIEKALISRNNSVGLPQLFKMIADGFKNVNDVGSLQGPKIYVKFIKLIYKRWSEQKGQIRNEASIDSQDFELNFNKFHQFHAILSLFPELAAILFPGYDGSEWPEEEVIACGILSLKNGKIYFLHETFREYFVADAIAKVLIKKDVKKKFIEILDEILTADKFKIIRTFLLPTLNEKSVLEMFKPEIQNLIFRKKNIFSEFFVENLENLADFAIKVLENKNYKKGLDILNKNVESIVENTKITKMFSKFQEFFINFLKVDDLKNFTFNQEVFQGIIKSTLEIEVFDELVMKIEAKTDREFVRQGLMPKSSDEFYKENIFYSLTQSSNLTAHKVNKFFEIMEKYLTSSEILELMNKCHENDQNILHCTAKWCENVEFHETLWKILPKFFKNQDELTDFILQKDRWKSNFVHKLVSRNENPEIIELTFKILKENFNDDQFQKILTSKGRWEMNLLQYAANESKLVKIHHFLWKLFNDFYTTDKFFWKMIKEVNTRRENILHIAASHSSSKVLEFMIDELEKIASRDEIRKIFRNLNKENQNFLQSAAFFNQSSELHETLWKTFRKYFEKEEILQFINHFDDDENNIILNAIKLNTKEIVELTWNQIKSFLNHDEQIEYLKVKRRDGKNINQISLENNLDKQEVTRWVKNQIKYYKINF